MAWAEWSNITIPSDTWTDVEQQSTYLVAQNDEIITDQSGNTIFSQGGMGGGVAWTDIT